MTELRKRMIECLQLRGFSERTQEAYVQAVRQLAEHYKKSPDLVTEEELRPYFLYIKNVKKYARPTTTLMPRTADRLPSQEIPAPPDGISEREPESGPLYPQTHAIILDCRDSRLWYAGELSKLILTQILKFSNDPHRFTNRDVHATLGRTKLTHLGLR